jgi:NADPH:quinone reductase-like Zn-dependent oxidoreductase
MKTTALTARQYGQPDVLDFTKFELPVLASDMARIEVKAAGINPVDARRMTGELRFGNLPLFFGTEYAGTIVALNGDGNDWTVGNEVLGSGGEFTHATIIDVPIANLVRRPPSMPWGVAGSLAGAAQTAITILEELGTISSLLVHGGAGGVGSITIQLARQQGIAVVATASEANQTYLRSLGAVPVVYGPELVERLKQVRLGLFDASIDMAGSDEATEASLARVKPDGVIGSITVNRPTSPRVKQIMRRRDPALVERVLTGVASGELKWEVSATHEFENARNAYKAILGRHVRGKSVLTF